MESYSTLEIMKVSLVITVLNEEKTIDQFLDSVASQSLKPDEVVIVDGGSTDATVSVIANFREYTKLIVKKGANRAEGRNLAIKKASGEVIAVSDAGCILEKNWLEEITGPFADPKVEVVAGFYQGRAKTVFEKCVVPYVLVMPDRVDANNFLPASRSMAIRKNVWQKLGGFPEKFSDNEDYVFAQNLKKAGAKIVFCPEAKVYWLPRTNLKDFFMMIYRFARGDAYAGLRFWKMATVFGRYSIAGLLVLWDKWVLLVLAGIGYLVWAIAKNFRYVKEPAALFWLPVLQIMADLGVMGGAIQGVVRRFTETVVK